MWSLGLAKTEHNYNIVMSIREFIEHISTAATLEGLNIDEAEIKFIHKDGREIDPNDIWEFDGNLVLSFK